MSATIEEKMATGHVIRAFGNLLQVKFEGNVRQGEVAFVELDDLKLKAEVIEVAGDEVKIQVFEDTRGIELGTKVVFTTNLLEAELGPGLISSIVDGLQNPLERVADSAGLYLTRGIYLPSLDRERKWDYKVSAKVGDTVRRGDVLGWTMESRFHHYIMVPFSKYGTYTVSWLAPEGSYTVEEPIARIKDEKGNEHEVTMLQRWPIKLPLIEGKKVKATEMMDTGMRIVDTQFPVLKGGTFCSPGPFGAGKTVIQHHLSKYSSIDLVIVTACGERAGEVVEVIRTFPQLTDPHTGDSLMSRTIMICNTSSMPVSAREASIYLGVTIAEYYRQMGLDVLLLADSTSRWAQAMREMSGRLEEIPGEEAFPAYLASRIASFYERSGVVEMRGDKRGSITIGGAVSPAGGNFEEPVTQATLAVVGAFLALSRERSDARKYPAIDPMISWTKYVDQVGSQLEEKCPGWSETVKMAAGILRQGDEIGKRMEVVGEEGVSVGDLKVYLKAELYEFAYLQQNAFDKQDTYCPLERQMELMKLVHTIFKSDIDFNSHDEARSFFLGLQNSVKNMNYMPYKSEKYHATYKEIESKIAAAMGED